MTWKIPVYEGETESQAITRWQKEIQAEQNASNSMPGRKILGESPVETSIKFLDENDGEYKEMVIEGFEAVDKWNQKFEDAKKKLGSDSLVFVKKGESYGFRKQEIEGEEVPPERVGTANH